MLRHKGEHMNALIWDLDGTLIDSNPFIIQSVYDTAKHFQIDTTIQEVTDTIVGYSVHDFFLNKANGDREKYEAYQAFYKKDYDAKHGSEPLMSGALTVLEWAKQQGMAQFIVTHKGEQTESVLEALGIAHYFTHVISAVSGFPRKPDPSAVLYLCETYRLDKRETCYIGDRTLDFQAAKNAGIMSYNLTVETQEGNKRIASLQDLLRQLQEK